MIRSALETDKEIKRRQSVLEKQLEQDRIDSYKRMSESTSRAKERDLERKKKEDRERAQSLVEAQREMKRRQLMLEKEVEQDRIDAYKRASESSSRAKAREAEERRKSVHYRSVSEASILKTQREHRKSVEADAHGVEMYRLTSEYDRQAKARRSSELKTMKAELAASVIQTRKCLKEAEKSVEAEREEVRLQAAHKRSEIIRERKERDRQAKRELDHAYAAAKIESQRSRRSLVEAREKNSHGVETYRQRKEYTDRVQLELEREEKERKHQAVVSLVQQRKEMKEASRAKEAEFEHAHMEERLRSSEFKFAMDQTQ
jgi:hypothetical protein